MKHPWSSQSFTAAARSAGRSAEMIAAAEAIADAIKRVDPDLPVIFTLQHLAHLIDVRAEDLQRVAFRQVDAYRVFRVKKRGISEKHSAPARKQRTICVPYPFLMKTQRWIAQNILNVISPHSASFAFAPNRDLVGAAKRHSGAKWLLKMDVRNFFESISERDVYHVFRSLGYVALLSFQMARLCTRLPSDLVPRGKGNHAFRDQASLPYRPRIQGHLPQGAPSSPMLANLAMISLDKRLSKMAKKEGFIYTRYADDLAFSRRARTTRSEVFKLSKRVEAELEYAGLKHHQQKTKISPPGARKVLLGLLVDDSRPRLTKSFRNNVETHIYALLNNKIGASAHQKKRGFASVIGMRRHLGGLISFVHQVDPVYASKLYERFNIIDWTR